ncbi:MAG: TIGR04283 family arsenosugar biosynthesis glycosyltransferase [Opitutaceae bacterium]
MRTKLIVMLKYPRPGAVKTRLIPALGEARACELYRALVRHTLGVVDRVARVRAGAVEIEARVAGAPALAAARSWLGESLLIREQGDGDLGERMERATREAFAEGWDAAVIIGGDCPELAAEHLASAFAALNDADVVLGPAADGGYYLIGMRQFHPELFRDIAWGGERVLAQTLGVAGQLTLECKRLDTLRDLDRPEDLPAWALSAAAREHGKGGVSVVIPAHNESRYLSATLEAARRSLPHEIIIVDGDSTDATNEIAVAAEAIVLTAPRCRAIQMNRGAAIATGDYLLFLHADTLLPENYLAPVREILGRSGVTGGAFAFASADGFRGRALIERVTNWRARRWQLPYGDQGLFLRRELFIEMGGFPEIPLMEDYVFVHRLRRRGRIVIAPCAAKTSGRRWRELGALRTTLVNHAIVIGYHLGVSPPRLAHWYRGGGKLRGKPSPEEKLRSKASLQKPTVRAI